MVRTPPSGIASTALTTRLSTTCSICPGSALTLARSGASSSTSVTSSPTRRWIMSCRPAAMALRSTISGLRICRRLTASRRPVSAAARSPARRIWVMSRRVGSSSAIPASTRSAMPLITVSRLLKSCATPPARRPTISIFCACCSCSSSWRCSVMSAAVPTRRYSSPASSYMWNARSRIQRTAPSGRMMR